MDDETAVQSRTERWRAELCVSVCLFSTHNSHALSCTHAHMHTLHVCALLTMLCWWTSRGTESQEVRLLPNARLKKKVLRCHAGDRIKHKRAHTKLWRNVVSLHSFSHVCESIYHFFLSVTSSYTICVISVHLVWIQIMLAFLSAVGAAREKQVGKIEKE